MRHAVHNYFSIWFLAVLLMFGHPSAASPSKPSLENTPSPLSTAIAIGPGVLVHGLGHYVNGQKKTAWRLLKWQGVSMGAIAISAGWLGGTGASRYGNELAVPLLVSGTGLFLQTWVADIYGNATGGTLQTPSTPAVFSLELGGAYVHEPQFAFSQFATVGVNVNAKTFSISPTIWLGVDAYHQRLDIPARLHLIKNQQQEMFSIHLRVSHQDFGRNLFAKSSGEVGVTTRIELSRIGPTLAGSFVTATAGVGLEASQFTALGSKDYSALPVASFGYGLYLPRYTELLLRYSHQKNDLAGGISPGRSVPSGFLGHVSAIAHVPIYGSFSMSGEFFAGSAYIARISASWSLL